jgi:DNA polymerase sigma
MEEGYSRIEETFVNYLISLIGPTDEENTLRETKFQLLKKLLEEAFYEKGYNVKLLNFGSFPLRTYLPESDMDSTLIFENENGGYLILNQDQQREYYFTKLC